MSKILNPFEPQQDRNVARRIRCAYDKRLSAYYADLMRMTLDPFRQLLISLAGYVNQQQQEVIDYLQEENRVLHEQLGSRRLRLNDDQRRRLAVRRTVQKLDVIEIIGREEALPSLMNCLRAFAPTHSKGPG